MTQLRSQIRRVAPYFRTALLIGEPGCGEQAAAHTLHKFSPLSHRPFIDLASPDASLFSAAGPSDEAFASAGMFYISRPDQLSRDTQTALLRSLRRYGPLAPRIVAIAERSLRPLVSANGFSAELADRLGALRIVLPPLRNRSEDIPQLLAEILQRLANQSDTQLPDLAPDLMDTARNLPWRGNITQLHSAAQGLIERPPQLILQASDLDAVLSTLSQSMQRPPVETRMIRLDEVIQEHVRAVLVACNGNKLRTAEVLGISRSTLYRMLDLPIQAFALPRDSPNLHIAS